MSDSPVPPRVDLVSAREVLRRLDVAITRKLDGLLQGDYRGLVPGHGTEPGETREYQPGDDVRRIDWNVTARMTEVHVRDEVADRELEGWVLTDLSASLDFGTALCEKRDLAVAATAAVGFLTNRGGNRLGAIILEGGKPVIVPARQGRQHLQGLLHRVIIAAREDAQGPTDLAAGIGKLASVAGRRGLAVVVSDFLSSTDWERSLRALSARHDVLAVEVIDPRELELPDVGFLALVDPETGARREVHTSPKLRNKYATAAAEQREGIAAAIRRAGADHLVLRTDRDWLGDLVRFVTFRRKRIENVRRVTT